MDVVEVTFIIGNDWQGLYINGELTIESHQIDTMDALNEIAKLWKHKHLMIEEYLINPLWLENQGELPIEIRDIPRGELNFKQSVYF